MQTWRIGYIAVALFNICAVLAVGFSAALSKMNYLSSQEQPAMRTLNPATLLPSPVEVVVYFVPEMAGLGVLWLALASLVVIAFVVLLATRWPREASRPGLFLVVRASIIVGVAISLPFTFALLR